MSVEIIRSKERCACGKVDDKENLLTCSSCKLALYCNSKCQHTDWQHHKKTCGKIRSGKKKVRKCNYCSTIGTLFQDLKPCEKCGFEFYCRKECERVDLSEHNEICNRYVRIYEKGEFLISQKYLLSMQKK
jgi:hypothetical protein